MNHLVKFTLSARLLKQLLLKQQGSLLTPTNLVPIPRRIFGGNKMADDFANFDATLSLQDPVADYAKLIKEKIQCDRYIDDDVHQEMFGRVAAAARETVWKLLFAEQSATKENLEKAAELLETYKPDACFYNPYDYNEWISTVRDELLKRKMLDFWKNVIVKGELGPCWARDSDLFDDLDDPEAAAFYNHAGCVAPFAEESQQSNDSSEQQVLNDNSEPLDDNSQPLPSSEAATPAGCFAAKLQNQLDIDPDDQVALEVIFKDARDGIWQLLFADATLTEQQYQQSADLLVAYKREACFFSPFEYNKWIPKLRDELFARKYLKFWKEIVVDKKCGLCCHRDSDYFDDPEDTAPQEFLKSGDEQLKNAGLL